jgi:rod shape-determining protein MreC
MRRRPFHQHQEWQSLAVLTLIAIALLVAHHRARAGRDGSRADRVARAVLMPLQETLVVIWERSAHTAGGLTRARRLAEENARLKAENAQLEARLIQGQELRNAYREALEAFGLKPLTGADEIPARVIGSSTRRFIRQTIDLVSLDGREVRKQDIVLWNKFLVGRIESAQGGRARATLLLDPDSGVAAVVQPSDVQGALVGPDPGARDAGLLRLVHLERDAPIAVNDKVYTSDLGEVYPKGIPVGTVEEVIGGAGTAEPKTALVKPYADFGNLTYVTVFRPEAP